MVRRKPQDRPENPSSGLRRPVLTHFALNEASQQLRSHPKGCGSPAPISDCPLKMRCGCSSQGASQVAPVVKNPLANAGDLRDTGLIPGSGRSPGGGHVYPLQHACLESPRHRGAWRAAVHGVAKSQTGLKRLSMSPLFASKTALCLETSPMTCTPVNILLQ